MEQLENYISILQDGLVKKLEILQCIKEWNEKQDTILKEAELDMELFDHTVEEKATLLETLAHLDEGFEATYDRIKVELEANKGKYRSQIGKMQELISQIMDLAVCIQASESRNKNTLDSKLMTERKRIKEKRVGQKAAMNYYKSASKVNYIDPQLMDQKK